jgi:hypothetical protein
VKSFPVNKKRLSIDNLYPKNFWQSGVAEKRVLARATVSDEALAHFATTAFRSAGRESSGDGHGEY